MVNSASYSGSDSERNGAGLRQTSKSFLMQNHYQGAMRADDFPKSSTHLAGNAKKVNFRRCLFGSPKSFDESLVSSMYVL